MVEPPDRPVPLDHHLGWQGWQLDLPASWNPVRFQGNARRGGLALADLDRQQVELAWRPVRSGRGVDLSRLMAAPAGRRLTPSAPPAGYRQRGFADARVGRTAEGQVVGMFLSAAAGPARLLLVRFAGTPDATPVPVAERILATLADALALDPVPWCVYGFAWAVPAGFELSQPHIVSGRACFTFRRGRAAVSVERRVLMPDGAGLPTEPPSGDPAAGLDHRGHEVRMAPASARTWWDRLISGPRWVAEWNCPQARRRYRVEASGPDARELLRQTSARVVCHRPAL